MIAGLADYARPADKLSLTQSVALTATGKLMIHRLNTGNTTHHHHHHNILTHHLTYLWCYIFLVLGTLAVSFFNVVFVLLFLSLV